MKLSQKINGILTAVAVGVGLAGCAGTDRAATGGTKERIVIQVSDEDPRTWNQALNVAANLQAAYGDGNGDIELVSFGRGIGMLKAEALVANRV